MKAFEDATGEPLPEDKKELATEELITTGDLGDDIGQDKATGVINDIKTQIIKNGTKDTIQIAETINNVTNLITTGDLGDDIGQDKATGVINDIKTQIIKNGTKDTIQIAETINNVTNNYNITLSPEQQKQIEDLMKKIADQNYDYNKIKETLNNVSNNVDKNLAAIGESINNKSFFDTIKGWFSDIGEWFGNLFGGNKDLGILENTNDELLGNDAPIDATDKNAINLPSSEQVEGFFAKIWNWFTGLFNNNNNSNNADQNSQINDNNDNSVISPNEETNSHFDTNDDSSNGNESNQNNDSEDTSSTNESQHEEQSTENNSEIPPAQ